VSTSSTSAPDWSQTLHPSHSIQPSTGAGFSACIGTTPEQIGTALDQWNLG
jgi:hypothetical protein